MSTNAYICYKTKDGCIKGVYNHWDGYPDWLGKKIVEVAEKKFIENRGSDGVHNNAAIEQALEAFIQVYIKGHPGGWSTFDTECYCHSPEFIMRDGYHEMVCECDNCFTQEFAYIIIPHEERMEVYSGHELIGEYDFCKRKWIKSPFVT